MDELSHAVLLVGRAVLFGVFAIAGTAKLFDRRGARRAITDLGVPARLAGPAVALLPVVELMLATALLFAPPARLAAVGIIGLLGLFSILVAGTLRRGESPDCHCFGQMGGGPVGRGTLVRNAVLAAVALAVAAGGPGYSVSDAVRELGDRPVSERILLVGGPIVLLMVFGLGRTVFRLLAQQGRLLLRVDALEDLFAHHQGVALGAPAPPFSLPDLEGRRVSLADLLDEGRPVLLVFTDPNCGPCAELMPELAGWERDYGDVVTIRVISRRDPAANRAMADAYGLAGVLVQTDREVARLYEASATPSAVLIGEDGHIAGPLVAGGVSIWRLLLRAPRAVALRPPTEPWPRISNEVEAMPAR